MQISEELAATHYSDHKERPFYAGLVSFMTSSPVLVLALEGVGAIAICRSMMGATFGSQAVAGTIRGDFGVSNSFNLIHGSDSPEAATKELGLFFNDGEISSWNRANEGWVYDLSGDEEAARRGDEDAASRLRTQRYISTRSQRLLTAT